MDFSQIQFETFFSIDLFIKNYSDRLKFVAARAVTDIFPKIQIVIPAGTNYRNI